MLKKFKYKKSFFFVLFLVLTILLLHTVINYIIENKFKELLAKNNSQYYSASINGIKFNILPRTLTLKEIFVSPSNESFTKLKEKKYSENTLEKISIHSIKLKGIHLFKLLFSNKIEVNSLIINDILVQKFINSNLSDKKTSSKDPINIDSIYIEKIQGFQINQIKLNNFKFQVFDFSTDEIVFQNSPLSFDISGFKLEQFKDHLFKLRPLKNRISVSNINLSFEKIKYLFSAKNISYDFDKEIIVFENLNWNPSMDRIALANTYKFNKKILAFHLKELKIYNYDFVRFINNKGIFMDSISVNGIDISIYKDNRKPFDLNKRPDLPQIALKKMETPLHIPKITISNGNFKLETRLEKRDALMKVSIDKISAEITNITSIKKLRRNSLKVNLKAKLMKSADMKVYVDLPLNDNQNRFYFNGRLGPAKLKLFDTALFPVLGLKVLQGDLDGLIFNASADSMSSKGTMTMLYHDLEAEVFKSHSLNENKFLSWTVNNVVRESNPGKNGIEREVIMNFNRVEYKGLGNFFWKTLQTGIVNTIAPGGGKQTKSSKKNRHDRKRKH